MKRFDSTTSSVSGTQSEDEINYIEIKKEKSKAINIDIKLYEKLILLNIRNKHKLMKK
jgi:hypothetical protein